MQRLLLVGVLLACACGQTPPVAPTQSPPEPPSEVPPAPPPASDDCAPFIARAREIAGRPAPACVEDADCSCRSGLLFEDCGAAVHTSVAVELAPVLSDSAAANCNPPGPRCAPRECVVRCESGRCVGM